MGNWGFAMIETKSEPTEGRRKTVRCGVWGDWGLGGRTCEEPVGESLGGGSRGFGGTPGGDAAWWNVRRRNLATCDMCGDIAGGCRDGSRLVCPFSLASDLPRGQAGAIKK